ncbi:MAG: serine/threonine-protein kinase [Vulcanimicrobiota bacterium]
MTALAEFSLEKRIGRGSYGDIFLAAGPDGPAAIKVLRADRQTPQMTSRFRAEVAALEKVCDHPWVVSLKCPLREVAEGGMYYAMEYLPGGTLDDLVKVGGYGLSQVLAVAAGLAEGLARIHQAGLLHRDLCLKNVLLDGQGGARISDFGLCRPTQQDEGATPDFWFAHGDPECASPERLFHIESGELGDVYSLGSVLYSLLTRRSLFALSELAFLYSIYTRQVEQFFRTCIQHQLPCPTIDFRAVYDHYLKRSPELKLTPLAVDVHRDQLAGLTEVVADLVEPDYWRRLKRFGSLEAVAARLRELGAL